MKHADAWSFYSPLEKQLVVNADIQFLSVPKSKQIEENNEICHDDADTSDICLNDADDNSDQNLKLPFGHG